MIGWKHHPQESVHLQETVHPQGMVHPSLDLRRL